MKRIGTMLLTVVMLLGLTSCGGAAKIDTESNLWQEQYDLGIKYLSDGNYEEAIIAFTAAIKIDPKQSAAYESAAKAYEAMGDLEAAKAILEQGVAATEDAALVTYLESLTEQLESLSTPSPETAPELPEIVEDRIWGVSFLVNNYVSFTRKDADAFANLIFAGLTGDMETTLLACEAVLPLAQTLTEDFENQDRDGVILWTVVDNALFRYRYHNLPESQNGYDPYFEFEINYRPMSAMGFDYYYREEFPPKLDISQSITVGDCSNMLYNGSFNYYRNDVAENGYSYNSHSTGTALDGYLHGELVIDSQSVLGGTDMTPSHHTSYLQYDNGIALNVYDDGTANKKNVIQDTGEVMYSFVDRYSNPSDPIPVPWGRFSHG